MKVAFDLDGVILSEKIWPSWIPIFLIPFLLFFQKEMSGSELLKKYPNQFIIITARPKWSKVLIKIWFWVKGIHPKAIFCVGIKGDKVPILLKEKVDLFFDDKQKNIDTALKQEINSHLFQSWDQVKKILNQPKEGGRL